MKKVLCLILAAMLMITVGCTENNKTKPQDKTEEKGGEAKSGITIYSLKDDTLCPILTDNAANRQMLLIVHESLVRLKDTLEPEGVLATSWSVSPDGLKWTFTLRESVKWHSGEALTPDDVIYTVEQIKKNPESSYFNNVRHIEAMEASGSDVLFTLSTPCSLFPNLMTFPVIKAQSTDIDPLSYLPNGTGAYVFSDKNEGNMYYLLRNDNWWGGTAKTKEIKVKLLPDSETVMYSLSAGDIDIADSERGSQGRFVSGTDVNTSSCRTTIYNFLGFNHEREAIAQKEVRQAISMAINRKKIVDEVFAGNASLAKSPIRQEWFMAGADGEDYGVKTTEAKTLLEDNGWTENDGVYKKNTDEGSLKLELTLLVNEENINRINAAEGIKNDLKALGINLELISVPYDEYMKRISEGNYDMFLGSMLISADLDYEQFLGEGNIFRYQNEELSKIVNDACAATDREKIISKYGEFKGKFNSEIPVVGICFENFDMLQKKRISGKLKSSQDNIYYGIFNLEAKG